MAEDIRVLVVDDSAFARMAISREIKQSGGISVADYARDGVDAIEKIKSLKPDVVTLDVEMPKMDGLTTLEKIMRECPTPVVMISSLTGKGTDTTIRALELGAVDFFLKNTLANPIGDEASAVELRNKIVTAARIKSAKPAEPLPEVLPDRNQKKISSGPGKKATTVVVIGSSTGGPKALYQVIPSLPADIPAAVLVVQHMPPGFTYSLANRLNQLSHINVKEVEPGDVMCEGTAYIARGGYHMVVEKGGILALNQDPPVCGVRPSVNVTMQSAAPVFKKATLGVILTGMGCDGTLGAQFIKLNRGKVIAEDESTCVVWGMPKSVSESGYADKVIPLPKIAAGIMETLEVRAKE